MAYTSVTEQTAALIAERKCNKRLKDENAKLKAIPGQAICAYCGKSFGALAGDSKEQIAGLAASHIANCEKSPLVRANARLKEFARYVIKTECWSMFEHNGGTIQELAEKLGLIEPCIVTQEELIDQEFDDYNAGDTIYKFTGMLKGD